jgi:head-tail adaptor
VIDPGKLTHAVTIQSKTRTKEAGGGWTEVWANLSASPTWWCSIEAATVRAMERTAGGGAAVISSRTCILQGHYHSGIKTGMRMVEGARVFNVTGVDNDQSANEKTTVIAEEVVTP